MDEQKRKKKTLTISTNLNKKIDISSIKKDGKESYSIEKKKPFKSTRDLSKSSSNSPSLRPDFKKNSARKLIEQQATKAFIKKDEKQSNKSRLKLKGPIDKRDFKLTVSRALNVEEIEIKQRSLASVKRARLKEKKNILDSDDKREFKKVVRDVKLPEQISIQELSIQNG